MHVVRSCQLPLTSAPNIRLNIGVWCCSIKASFQSFTNMLTSVAGQHQVPGKSQRCRCPGLLQVRLFPSIPVGIHTLHSKLCLTATSHSAHRAPHSQLPAECITIGAPSRVHQPFRHGVSTASMPLLMLIGIPHRIHVHVLACKY